MDSSEKLNCLECERSLRYPNERKTVHIIYLKNSVVRSFNDVSRGDIDECDSIQATIPNDLLLEVTERDAECNYKCAECEMSFAEFTIFEDHLKNHNPYKCEVCGICFPTASLLDYHCRIHKNNSTLLPCKVCKKMFHFFNLKKHEKTHTVRKQYRCSQCKSSFLTEDRLQIHKIKHEQLHNGFVNDNQTSLQSLGFGAASKSKFDNQIGEHTKTNQLTCQVCFKSFTTKYNLVRHALIHAGDSFKCTKCGEEFSENSQLVEHYKTHTLKPYKCTVCDKMYDTLSLMQNHYRLHLIDKPFMCSKCSDCFVNEESLNAHLSNHNSGNFYHFKTCSKCFKSVTSLQVHYRTHTGEKPYSCPSCERAFADVGTMRRHYRVIHGETKFEFPCSLCSKTFSRKSNLKTHTESCHSKSPSNKRRGVKFDKSMFQNHTVENKIKSYVCKLCGKLFKQKNSLDLHYRIHTGEKPYLCSKCGKQCLDLSGLKRHYRIHTGEKPFKCSECDKCFTDHSTYRRHCRVHTGEKPHVCQICGKSFSDTLYLKRHFRYHTGEKPYKCSFCDKAFVERGTLTKHYKVHLRNNTGSVVNVQDLVIKNSAVDQNKT